MSGSDMKTISRDNESAEDGMGGDHADDYVWVWGEHGCERMPFDTFVGKGSIPVESFPVTDYNESHLMFVDLGNGYLLANTDM